MNAGNRPSFAPAFGFSINVIFPGDLETWALYNEVLYTSYKVSGEYILRENANNFSTNTTQLGFTYLSVTNILRYQYSPRKIRPFFQLGLRHGFMLSNTNLRKKESSVNGIKRTEVIAALEELRTYEQSVVARGGLSHQRVSFELRTGFGNGMSKFNNPSSVTTRYFFSVELCTLVNLQYQPVTCFSNRFSVPCFGACPLQTGY